MYYEKLALQVAAGKAGWQSIEPASNRGASGVVHRYTFMASDGSLTFGFDSYDSVNEFDVLRTYIKQLDTGISTAVVCLRGSITEKAQRLADEYNMKILGSIDIENFFVNGVIELEAQSNPGATLRQGMTVNNTFGR